MLLSQIHNPIFPDLGSANAVDLTESTIVTLINVLYVVGVVAFFFMLVIGGIQWLSSGGDQQALANAKARIQHAVIGLTILMSAFAIVTLIEAVFDINILLIDVSNLGIDVGSGGGGSGGSGSGSLE
jgi:hypothetical protein